MRLVIFSFLLTSWLLLVFPIITSAQGMMDTQNMPYSSLSPNFNLWWVLPLIALPFALWILARNSSNYSNQDEVMYHQLKRERLSEDNLLDKRDRRKKRRGVKKNAKR